MSTGTITFTTMGKYNCTPSKIHHIACNFFSIRKEFSHCFQSYFILHYKAPIFLSQLEAGAIKKDGKKYIVIFGEGASRGKILATPDCTVLVSFREAMPEFEVPPYAIVQIKSQEISKGN